MIDEPTAAALQESTSAHEPNLRDKVIDAIKTIYDPEIPINIYELGLIYEVRIEDKTNVHITMTLTTPNCPSAQSLPREVEQAARGVEGVESVNLELTFDPPWDKTMMSEAALFSIGLY
ncbi:MAG: SUF system Fe-S cluster assembly protein [Candidatus Kapabacteria bacterium]|nr:SUF system Fe-S cluster assembly protein [Candidatus Kapabacteria bacterium]